MSFIIDVVFWNKTKDKKPKTLINHSYNKISCITYITGMQPPVITKQDIKVFTAFRVWSLINLCPQLFASVLPSLKHRVCDVAYDEKMCGPIRTRKFRSTNQLTICFDNTT